MSTSEKIPSKLKEVAAIATLAGCIAAGACSAENNKDNASSNNPDNPNFVTTTTEATATSSTIPNLTAEVTQPDESAPTTEVQHSATATTTTIGKPKLTTTTVFNANPGNINTSNNKSQNSAAITPAHSKTQPNTSTPETAKNNEVKRDITYYDNWFNQFSAKDKINQGQLLSSENPQTGETKTTLNIGKLADGETPEAQIYQLKDKDGNTQLFTITSFNGPDSLASVNVKKDGSVDTTEGGVVIQTAQPGATANEQVNKYISLAEQAANK